MAAGDLTTIAAVKAWGGVSAPTASDSQIQNLITAISAFVVNFTGRGFGTATFMEIRNGSGGTELYLSNQPLISVQSLTIDTVNIPAQIADGQPGYFISGVATIAKVISLNAYKFTRGQRNVRVSYTSGFGSIPADLAQACNEAVMSAFRRGPRGAEVDSHTSRITQETTRFDLKMFPPACREVFEYYRKTVPL